jgi:hypothetical protein
MVRFQQLAMGCCYIKPLALPQQSSGNLRAIFRQSSGNLQPTLM